MTQEQIKRYNKQKGKARDNKLLPKNAIDIFINSRIEAREIAEQQQIKETIDRQLKEEIEKQIKDIFK